MTQVTKQTYQQGAEYVQWRAKQNFDYAFLMRFSANLSLYYMQLEDDVTTVSNYVNSIRKYIEQQTESWTCLEFSELGFIGISDISCYLQICLSIVAIYRHDGL